MRKLIATATAAIAALALTACGASNDAPAGDSTAGPSGLIEVKVGASPTPHAEILEVAKEILAAKGITLDIQEYDDYIIPNNVVEDGTVDTNYFQHQPYLDDFNAEHGTHLVTVAGIHVEPMGIYGGKQDSLAPIEG